jgi:hypothetical protein
MPIELHGGEFVGRYVTKATYDASLKAGFEIASGASSRYGTLSTPSASGSSVEPG